MRMSLETDNETEAKARKKAKSYYDRKSRQDSFDEGDQVLLVLPLIGKPLQAKYCGSYMYIAEKRIGGVDYLVQRTIGER